MLCGRIGSGGCSGDIMLCSMAEHDSCWGWGETAPTIGAAGELGEVELDLVPAVVKPHGHGADEVLHPRGALVVAGPEAAPLPFVVHNSHLEAEIPLEVLHLPAIPRIIHTSAVQTSSNRQSTQEHLGIALMLQVSIIVMLTCNRAA